MRTFTLVAAVGLLLSAAGVALSYGQRGTPAGAANGSADAAATEIRIDNFTFNPADIHVKAGTQVTWVNRDDIPHNVIAEDKSFRSKTIDTDEKFTFTAAQPGTYMYFCGIHPKMKGKLVVE
ncbi:MAG TPA: cupredoxin family copper-binding protein [Terriglobales bacterium]|nr:cupredoxin family copper-binding protein [Terriglobales bacterium]